MGGGVDLVVGESMWARRNAPWGTAGPVPCSAAHGAYRSMRALVGKRTSVWKRTSKSVTSVWVVNIIAKFTVPSTVPLGVEPYLYLL
jgi:hypothetical protein